ncbi:MAG: OPT family oligopeptide transporter [Planctomycetota bacterium]|jgi:uncharacterized oligopeptide transporter (OPT) family protein
MALFQKPPRTPEEAAQFEPLDIGPEQVLEMSEEEWYEKVYRGEDVPQLTFRAVAVGSGLGFLLAFTNLYIGLKTGWALGVAITACILSYAMWTMLVRSGAARSPMTILETNCMQSTASSAGYSTGGTMVSAIAAMLLLSVTLENPGGVHIDPLILIGWTIALAALGTIMAIPMKRNLINRDRLKFPSGTAAAVTLQSLYSHGEIALQKAKVLGMSAGVGALFSLGLDFNWLKSGSILPGQLNIFNLFRAPGAHDVEGKQEAFRPSDWTMALDVNPVMIAAGALVGLRIGFYMLVGGLVLVFALGGPALESEWTSPYGAALDGILIETQDTASADGLVSALEGLKSGFPGYATELSKIQALELDPGQPEVGRTELMRTALSDLAATQTFGAVTHPAKAWKEVGLWLGVSIMLAYGILQFLSQWRTILRAFTGLGARSSDMESPLVKETEVPGSWFAIGTAVSGMAAILIAQFAFDIPMYFGALAVGLTFFLSMVAARATGESDITPVGAMGKIMQLTFGTIMPQSASANLMSASITANAAGSAADLLNDLKSGYLLGANPRRQFIAQIWGIAAGTAATVLGFYLLVPDASVMTPQMLPDGTMSTPQFPAPAAQAWMAIAKVMTGGGLEAMHPMHRQMIFWGLGLGTAMLILEMLFPKQRGWLPSATGLGLGLILPFNYPLSMFLGAVIAAVWAKKSKESNEFYMIPIVSGLIAGISIFGVIGAVMNTFVL